MQEFGEDCPHSILFLGHQQPHSQPYHHHYHHHSYIIGFQVEDIILICSQVPDNDVSRQHKHEVLIQRGFHFMSYYIVPMDLWQDNHACIQDKQPTIQVHDKGDRIEQQYCTIAAGMEEIWVGFVGFVD